MTALDIVIRNGTIVTASDVFDADIGIHGRSIVVIGNELTGKRVIDASSRYVMPGAIDVHTHLDMPEGEDLSSSDDFWTGSVAAACGGTTTIIDFAIQDKGEDLDQALIAWRQKAEGRAAIDYSFHMLICDFREEILDQMAGVVAQGVSTFKLLFAYKGVAMVEDDEFFRIIRRAKQLGALVMVHCENGRIIDLLVKEAVAAGDLAPIAHARTRPPQAEAEAVARAIHLAEMAGAPLYVVHVSCAEALEQVRAGRRRGVSVLAETCPQYLLLDDQQLDTADFAGAKFVCSPPLRPSSNHGILWQALAANEFDVVATDHCPWNYVGQKDLGKHSFVDIPNGLPGVETRLPLMLSEGVQSGRLSLTQLVQLCCTNPAKIFGLYPQKGTIAPGSDADLVIIDPERHVVLRNNDLHQNVDYTPYEDMKLSGYPVMTLRRGEVIMSNGEFLAQRGSGQFLHRSPYRMSF